MRLLPRLGVVAVAGLLGASPAAAQVFSGSGQRATEIFPLSAGLAVIELSHRGAGEFVVRLLDDQGTVVGDVAHAVGIFAGSKALQIPRDGRYLFDVAASGDWQLRLRYGTVAEKAVAADTAGDPTGFVRGREEGEAVAMRSGTGGWLAKGLFGGLLAGPIGTAIAVDRAGKSAESSAEKALVDLALPVERLDYARGYHDGFASRLSTRRQRSAMIGGIVGTGVFVYAVFQLIHLTQTTGSDDPPPGGGPPAHLLPVDLAPVR